MSGRPKICKYQSMQKLVKRLRDDLNGGGQNFILLYAYNGTGKTRLSMVFKDAGKKTGERDTLYFNAFTEDLFTWDNDLDGDSKRVYKNQLSLSILLRHSRTGNGRPHPVLPKPIRHLRLYN